MVARLADRAREPPRIGRDSGCRRRYRVHAACDFGLIARYSTMELHVSGNAADHGNREGISGGIALGCRRPRSGASGDMTFSFSGSLDGVRIAK